MKYVLSLILSISFCMAVYAGDDDYCYVRNNMPIYDLVKDKMILSKRKSQGKIYKVDKKIDITENAFDIKPYKLTYLGISSNGKSEGYIRRSSAYLPINSKFDSHNYAKIDVSRFEEKLPKGLKVIATVSEYDSEMDDFDYGLLLWGRGAPVFITSIKSPDDITGFNVRDINGDGNDEIIVEGKYRYLTDPTHGSRLIIIGKVSDSYISVFKTDISYFSHEFEIVVCECVVEKGSITLNKLSFGKSTYIENGNKTFGTFYVLPVILEKSSYSWESGLFRELKHEKDIVLHAKSMVDDLRMRESPRKDSKIVTALSKNDEVIVTDIASCYPDDIKELSSNIWGYWVKCKNKKNKIGWIFAYYLDFDSDCVNSYVKFNGTAKDVKNRIYMNRLKLK